MSVFERYTDMLYRLCYSILLQKEDAEDAVQDVFLAYYRKPSAFADEDHERAWFIRAAVNRSRDLLRRRKVRAAVPLSEVEEILAGDGDGGDAEALAAVWELPEKYRIAVILHCLEGYSVRETALICRITQSAVKMRLARGREMLRKRLGEGAVTDAD